MKAELHTGREVWVNMPYGEFAVSMGEACLLAGGTGITAFSAFLAELPADYPCNVHIFYGARQPDLLIFRSVIQEASERCPRLLARYFVERNAGKDLFKGRPDPELVFSILPDPLALTYYLAGPPEMLADLVNGLTMLGVCDQSIRVDAWE
jgi:ferredoxin-NADP reductase